MSERHFRLVGIGNTVQLGKGGVNLSSNNGTLELRDSSNADLVPLKIGSPVDASHSATKSYVDQQVLSAGGAVTSVQWWPSRSSIPAGYIPADGQIINRGIYPDLDDAVLNNRVPVVSDANWLSTITNRGSYTAGNGTTTIRVPDYNGKSSGSLGRVFLSGDGTDSAGTAGILQRDQFQYHNHQINIKAGAGTGTSFGQVDFGVGAGSQYGTEGPPTNYAGDGVRTGSKTYPQNVTGCFIIKVFSAIVNAGSADVAALANQVQSLSNDVDFMIYYANGSQAAPATIIANTRYVLANPYPGYPVMVQCQINTGASWFDPGWATSYDPAAGIWSVYGSKASQLSTGQIVLQTGRTAVAGPGSVTGGGGSEQVAISSSIMRLLVWKLKGTL